MKRMREEVLGVDMAKVHMLLSCSLETKFKRGSSSPNHVFECKTCDRQFPSFQALGGHRASHKRPRTLKDKDQDRKSETESGKSKTKKHDCFICRLEFRSGQALGGHMRRHRMRNAGFSSPVHAAAAVAGASKIPVLMRSNSKRVMCLDMDLNLTPIENDLMLLFAIGNMAPKLIL